MRTTYKSPTFMLGSIIFIIVAVAYTAIIAPTISFWDCGEFIAAGSTFGIPHPPGNPLYVLLANIASRVLFFVPDPAMRISLLSAIAGAFTALFAFLTVVQILDRTIPSDSRSRQTVIFIGAILGGLLTAFSNTIVASSVEAEVNVPVLLPLIVCTWLTLKWSQRGTSQRDWLLAAIVLISFIGLGIHMYSMIILPLTFLYVVINDSSKRTDWRFMLTCLVLGLVIYRISWFLFLGPVVLLITFIFWQLRGTHKIRWRLCFTLAAAAILGFSVHLYIPLRSAMHPAIDMGHPATLQSFVDYLDRKQYGDESMISRMFWRRGSLKNQFGIEGHIGFGGFYLTQFFRIDRYDAERPLFNDGFAKGLTKLLLYLSPTFLLLYGWRYLFRHSRPIAVFLICITCATTLGMVVYLNFADGTHPEYRDYLAWQRSGRIGPIPVVHREVRVRDYFFIPGFMYCAISIGIGIAAVLQGLYTSRRRLVHYSAPAAAVIISLFPMIPMAYNLSENNRNGDSMAFAYAWNLLNSCEKDALLFTSGDNDTYPLWALQQTYGIRKDVRVAVLSLLNTSWYIRDCRDKEPTLPIQLSDRTIDGMAPELNPFTVDTQYRLPHAGITITVPSREHKPYLLVQDKIILHAIDANAWGKPVYFTGLPQGGMMGLEPYLVQQGMVLKVTSDTSGKGPHFDIARTEYLLDSVYRLTDFVNNRRIMKDETYAGMSHQIARLILQTVQGRLMHAAHRYQMLRTKEQSDQKTSRQESTELIRSEITSDIRKGIDRLDNYEKLFGKNAQSETLRSELILLQ